MNKINDPNLELLDLLGTSDSFMKLSNLDGVETIAIDTSEEVFLEVQKTLWLKWDKQYFIWLNAAGLAEKIIEKGKRIKNKSNQLYKAMRPEYQVLVKAKIIETGQEGIIAVHQKRLRSKIEEAIKNGTIRDVNFMVTTQNDKKKNGSSNTVKVIVPVKHNGDNYISDIPFPEREDPAEEMVDFYLKTLESLARGEKLNPEEVRLNWYDILEKYRKKEDSEEGTDSLDKIFGAKSCDDIEVLTARVWELVEKGFLEVSQSVAEKMKTKEGLEILIKTFGGKDED